MGDQPFSTAINNFIVASGIEFWQGAQSRKWAGAGKGHDCHATPALANASTPDCRIAPAWQ
jgi:hypothetical protein